MAQVDLHLSEDEFWGLTPRQFTALLARQHQQDEHCELLTGVIASAVANWSMGAPKKPLSPTHFMPSKWGRVAEKAKPKKVSQKRVADQIRAIFGGMAKQDS
jgi:hypothetical protein